MNTKTKIGKHSVPLFVVLTFANAAQAQVIDGARALLATGTDACNQGNALCGTGTCELELSFAVNNVCASLGALSAAISSGSQPAMQSAGAQTRSALNAIAFFLTFQTGGATDGHMSIDQVVSRPIPNGEAETMKAGGHTSACQPCFEDSYYCQRNIVDEHARCINRVREFAFCRLQTPYCDHRGAPFTDEAWGYCWNNSYYRQYLRLQGGRDCRCQSPPGASERQGGCPEFFGQAPGSVGIPPSCLLVGDGMGCARCCYAKCEASGDGRQSCLGRNREECDVCEWGIRTELARISMEGSLCNYDTMMAGMQVCYDMLQECVDACSHCPPPPGVCP